MWRQQLSESPPAGRPLTARDAGTQAAADASLTDAMVAGGTSTLTERALRVVSLDALATLFVAELRQKGQTATSARWCGRRPAPAARRGRKPGRRLVSPVRRPL